MYYVHTSFVITSTSRNMIIAPLAQQKQSIMQEGKNVTGFNVGINAGKSAGQIIFHVHVHLIPMRDGDVDEPRCGVRGVIPNKQSY